MFSELHTLIIYVVFGYSLLFPAVMLCLKVLSINHPLQRLQLYLLALAIPPGGFILYHTLLTKRCQGGLFHAGEGGEAFHFLCALSGNLLTFVLPLLAVLLLLGVLKSGAAFLLITRLRAQAVAPPEDMVRRIKQIVSLRGGNLQISAPEIIYSARPGFAAFTAGLTRPVLVLNCNLAAALSERELDTLITHELVHIRRRDTLKGWLLQLLRDITFLNPLSTILLKRCFLERECLCDRKAMQLTGSTPEAYAATLLKVWRLLLEQQPLNPGLASAFTGKSREMEYRIGSLLAGLNQERVAALPFYALMASLLIGSLIFLGFIC